MFSAVSSQTLLKNVEEGSESRSSQLITVKTDMEGLQRNKIPESRQLSFNKYAKKARFFFFDKLIIIH